MAEIKNTFTQGKMNKDLDERLLPIGQYRDAMNIQITNSEDSEVGTVQNILGNKRIANKRKFRFFSNLARCVGSISDEKNNKLYWIVIDLGSSYILQYDTSSSNVTYVLVDQFNILFPTKSGYDETFFVTGINIIDGMMFITDGYHEPKKINIQRCIDGTDQSNITHTQLIVNNQSLGDLKEEHITVIKKAPKYPPVLEMKDNIREGVIGGTFIDERTLATGQTVPVFTSNTSRGDTIHFNLTSSQIDLSNIPSAFSLQVGDKVVINDFINSIPSFPLNDYLIRGVITAVDSTGSVFSQGWRLDVLITSYSPDVPIGLDASGGPRLFALSLDVETEKLFEYKFPRFAIRYKYEDGEYSSFGPFSEVAFLPGNFDYHPKKAYNLGMTNRLNQLHVKEFIPSEIPLDVVAVDILYKEVGSNNVYVLETLRPTDPQTIDYNGSFYNAWNHINEATVGAYTNLDIKATGYYEIKSETIYSLLPENQLLRSYDNVPRSAFAQEISGSRIIYANYQQNYNLSPTAQGGDFKSDIDVTLTSFTRGELNVNEPYKSLKSLREYQVGVVYSDEYSRETPVLTSAEASVQTVKADADNSNQLSVRILNDPPAWAKGFKFYVKENSGEYYNLAMGRWYNAEDENLWLSFPSSDRNKVDIDTYIILKKGVEKNTLVKEKARYKIIDISNEAPDYIKRKKLPFGTITDLKIFTTNSNNFPIEGNDSFTFSANEILNTSAEDIARVLDEPGEELYIRFENDVDNKRSKDYRITSFNRRALLSTGNKINFKITEPFESDINFIHSTPAQPSSIVANTKVIFVVYRPENQSQFDGRFFVKIHNDVDTITNLGSGVVSSSNYRVLAQRKFYFLAPNHVFLHKNHEQAVSTTQPSSYPASPTQQANNSEGIDWDVIIDYPSTVLYDSTGTQINTLAGVESEYFYSAINESDFWYTFTAFFRQKAIYSINDRFAHEKNSTDEPEGFEDIWYVNGHQYAGVYDPFQTSINQSSSILDPTGIAGNQIEIGFGGLEPDGDVVAPGLNYNMSYNEFDFIETPNPNNYTITGTHFQNKAITGWSNGNGNIYTLGDENINSNYGLEERDFINALKVGSKIRWQNDNNANNIYTILNIQKKYVLRYTSDVNSYVFRRPENFQTNYVLTLDKPIVWSPLSNGNMNGYSVNTDAYIANNTFGPTYGDHGLLSGGGEVLEILTEVDDRQLFPENPAIWETEPKEETPVNIYYEASKEYPVTLNDNNIYDILKIGSKIRVLQPGVGYNAEEYNIVYHLGDNLNIFTADPMTNMTYVDANGVTRFKLLEIINNETSVVVSINRFPSTGTLPGTSVTLTNDDRIVKISESFIYSNIELPYFNCYSFGNGVESNRIGDTFNKVFIDNGVIASTTFDDEGIYQEEQRKHGLIYSGLYNSTSGVNNLNQFIQAEKITKELNPVYGSIQKLFSRANAQGDLIAFCEDRVLNILANKDALFNADGSANVVSTNNVLGVAQPFAGDYGISKNPESFASESYRAYFTDKQRGAVLRLSRDGITAISDIGMKKYFGDEIEQSISLMGSYDKDKGEYNLTIKKYITTTPVKGVQELANTTEATAKPGRSRLVLVGETISFDETSNGWVSFKSFIPDYGISSSNKYYTFKSGVPYIHHKKRNRNTFYEDDLVPSEITFVFNQEPSIVKDFRAINYEGSQGKISSKYINSSHKNIEDILGWRVKNIKTNLEKGKIPYFVEKENKWFNYIKGDNFKLEQPGSKPDTRKFSVQGIGIASDVETTSPPPPPTQTPCNIAWSNTNFLIDWDIETNYDNATNELDTEIRMYTATGGTLDVNGGQNFEYEVTYDLIPNVMSGPAIVTAATNDLNSYPGMVDGTFTSRYDIEVIHDISNDVNVSLPLSPGTYQVQYAVTVKDLNHPTPNSCIAVYTFPATQFTIGTPPPPPPPALANGTLTLSESGATNFQTNINAIFTSASGGVSPYVYTDFQWRETDVNGVVQSNMSGVFTSIPSPVPNTNRDITWIWPTGQTIAHITVEYKITDNSPTQQVLTHSETITINRPALPLVAGGWVYGGNTNISQHYLAGYSGFTAATGSNLPLAYQNFRFREVNTATGGTIPGQIGNYTDILNSNQPTNQNPNFTPFTMYPWGFQPAVLPWPAQGSGGPNTMYVEFKVDIIDNLGTTITSTDIRTFNKP